MFVAHGSGMGGARIGGGSEVDCVFVRVCGGTEVGCVFGAGGYVMWGVEVGGGVTTTDCVVATGCVVTSSGPVTIVTFVLEVGFGWCSVLSSKSVE